MPACFSQSKLALSIRCARNSVSSTKFWDTSWLGNLAAKCWKHPNMSQTQHEGDWFTAFPAARACFHRNSFGLLPGFMSPLYTSGTLCHGISEKHVETWFSLPGKNFTLVLIKKCDWIIPDLQSSSSYWTNFAYFPLRRCTEIILLAIYSEEMNINFFALNWISYSKYFYIFAYKKCYHFNSNLELCDPIIFRIVMTANVRNKNKHFSLHCFSFPFLHKYESFINNQNAIFKIIHKRKTSSCISLVVSYA